MTTINEKFCFLVGVAVGAAISNLIAKAIPKLGKAAEGLSKLIAGLIIGNTASKFFKLPQCI